MKERGKIKFWYTGSEKEFNDLMTETFSMESYKESLHGTEMVIVDAGAFVGDTAFAFHPYAKKIYALEPSAEAYECLTRNIKELNLDKVTPINKGLWNTNGKERLYISAGGDTGACITPFTAMKRGFDIEVMTIDKLFEEYNIDHVDLLKVDIEGSEFALFESEGFKKVVDKIDKIVLEAHPFFVPGITGGSIWRIPYLLSKYGFVCKILNPDVNWSVQVAYSDGHHEFIPMKIFLAERK